jgi:RNA polymerase sigma-70 factor (ECF subfamily)
MQAFAPPTTSDASDTCVPAPTLVFADVYREYFGFVWRNARGLGTRPSALEDVVQEIFVVVYRRLPEFEGRSTLRTWLSRIVLNVVRHHRRSLSRKSPHERSNEAPRDPDALAAPGGNPCELAALSEGTRLVQRILDALDDEKREVLVLAEFEDLSVPEIADALSLNLNTAYSRLRLARKAFDEALARHRAQDGESRR